MSLSLSRLDGPKAKWACPGATIPGRERWLCRRGLPQDDRLADDVVPMETAITVIRLDGNHVLAVAIGLDLFHGPPAELALHTGELNRLAGLRVDAEHRVA